MIAATGPVTFKQEGTAVLQVFAPKGSGTGQSQDIAKCLEDAFRQWRSADRQLTVGKLERVKAQDGKAHTQLNVKLHYTSLRSA